MEMGFLCEALYLYKRVLFVKQIQEESMFYLLWGWVNWGWGNSVSLALLECLKVSQLLLCLLLMEYFIFSGVYVSSSTPCVCVCERERLTRSLTLCVLFLVYVSIIVAHEAMVDFNLYCHKTETSCMKIC